MYDKFRSEAAKRHGDGVVFLMSDGAHFDVDVVSTGSLSLDIALGIGGLPLGRVVEAAGNAGSGKTTLALHVVANAQKMGLGVVYIDAECALDVNYASTIGVDVDSLLISQPDYGEQALDIAEIAIRDEDIGVVVIDSVAALVPKMELDGEAGDAFIGLQARMMSQAMRRLSGAIKKSNTLVLFINQYRQKVSTMGYGGNKTTPGGVSLSYYSSVRLDVARIQTLGRDTATPFAQKTRVTVIKNKLAPPHRKAEFEIEFGTGISFELDVLDLAIKHKLVERRGSWYKSDEYNMSAQGRSGAKVFLQEHPEVTEDLVRQIKQLEGVSE